MRKLDQLKLLGALCLLPLLACNGSSPSGETDAEGPGQEAANGSSADATTQIDTEGDTNSDTNSDTTRAQGPTEGCGAQGVEGDFSIALSGGDADYRVTLPPNYDPNEPVPLVFAFHGRGRTHVELQEIDAAQIQTEIGGRAIVAYLKSQNGNGWNATAEVEPNIAFFESVYSQLLGEYCVDQGRVFAIGHSSGGYFSNILGCRFASRIRGIAAVAGAQQETECQGSVAAIVVHGVRDAVVSFESGQEARNHYLTQNGCGQATSPS